MGELLLSEIPSVESSTPVRIQQQERSGIVIKEHVLEFLLTMNHSEDADNPVPKSVSNLVHIIDTHIDQLQDLVTKLEMELDSVELDLDKGNFHDSLLDPPYSLSTFSTLHDSNYKFRLHLITEVCLSFLLSIN